MECRQRIAQQAHPGRVHVHVGYDEGRAHRLLAGADVIAVPSRFEPFGNVVVNAWAHDIPVVAAASQGPDFLITDGVDGLKVPKDDASALASAVNSLLAGPGLGARLVEGGRARVSAEFSETAVVKRYLELLENVIR